MIRGVAPNIWKYLGPKAVASSALAHADSKMPKTCRYALQKNNETTENRNPRHSASEKTNCVDRNLEGGVEAVAAAKDLERVADLPFVDPLPALQELVQLLPDAHLRATFLEQPLVQRLLQVLLRPLRHALRLLELLHKRHCLPYPFTFTFTPSMNAIGTLAGVRVCACGEQWGWGKGNDFLFFLGFKGGRIE